MTEKKIAQISKLFTKGILDGMTSVDKCFIVCAPLAAYLSIFGIECTLTEGEINHCEATLHHYWITLSNGKIIDPTADQFGLLNQWVTKQPSYYKQL